MNPPRIRKALFRFYEELNDFLPETQWKKPFCYEFRGTPSIKDAIEAIGVPHTEIDLIVVNSSSVGFDYSLQEGDRVSVYPVFESLDITPLVRLRPLPLRETRFVLDTHLGRLARYLRMIGLDSLYKNDFADTDIVRISAAEKRIILTRDRGILKRKEVIRGYWVRSNKPREQIREVIMRFDLDSRIRPFCRCINCNGLIVPTDLENVRSRIPLKTGLFYTSFCTCSNCRQVYWRGSHFPRMEEFINNLRNR